MEEVIITKYCKGKIYRICGGGLFYYGSTIQTLNKRLSKHKTDYKNYQRGIGANLSVFRLFDAVGMDNCHIELILDYPCLTLTELTNKEAEMIRANICVNHNIPGRTMTEYYLDHKQLLVCNICGCAYNNGKSYNKKRHFNNQTHIMNTFKLLPSF